MVKLLSITPSEKPDKKWKALFDTGKITHFGSRGAEDYTMHKDATRRDRYRVRHRKDLKTKDPMRAGFLSYYILWGDSTSFDRNVADYKRRFDL